MTIHKCTVCGHLMFGQIPETCPVCLSEKDKFQQSDNIIAESKEKSKEGAVKHTPVLTLDKDCKLIGGACIDVTIKVGEVAHPMEDKHFINFIDCYIDNKFSERVTFTPGVFAATAVHVKSGGALFKAVEFCNLHGYWDAEVSL